MQCFWVYLISNRSHTLYVGMTGDLIRRVRQHKERKYPNGFTARYVFDRLVYFEPHPTKKSAAAREREIKGWLRARKIALVQDQNPKWLDLTPSYTKGLRPD
jgi:putative endonuclease